MLTGITPEIQQMLATIILQCVIVGTLLVLMLAAAFSLVCKRFAAVWMEHEQQRIHDRLRCKGCDSLECPDCSGLFPAKVSDLYTRGPEGWRRGL